MRFNAIYAYQGSKMNGGQYDTKAEARERLGELRDAGFTGLRVEPVGHLEAWHEETGRDADRAYAQTVADQWARNRGAAS